MGEFERAVARCGSWKFLGFGNPDAALWIVGLEERGAEIREGGLSTAQSVLLRSRFPIAVDLGTTWEREFRHPLTALGQGTWWWASRLMLALEGNRQASRAEVRRYRDTGLGTLDGPCFLPDLYPLPMNRRNRSWDYAVAGPWASWSKYRDSVGPERANRLLKEAAARRGVRCLVAYSHEAGEALKAAADEVTVRRMPAGDGASWAELRVGSRRLTLAVTPFWGNGRYSIAELLCLAQHLQRAGL